MGSNGTSQSGTQINGSRNQISLDPDWTGTGLFGEIEVSPEVDRALAEMGYTAPTPIQDAVIRLLREGRDVVGQAQTGTGKTSAFGIPLVEMSDPSSREVQGLVLVPTRELAMQVAGELTSLGRHRGIRIAAIFGGQQMRHQLDALDAGVHVVVATPGRLMDHMSRRTLDLGNIRAAVLDEADQMLDIGFAEDIARILRTTPNSRQTLLFSATMPQQIRRLASRYLQNPEWVRVGEDAAPVEGVEQFYYEVAAQDCKRALEGLLEEPDLITQALIFRRTKVGVDKLVDHLVKRGYDARGIHSDMVQGKRDKVMVRFREKNLRLLVATNVAARGLDIPAVSHVINYDMPDNLEEYVHRVGRTARMGRHGTAMTFVSHMQDFEMLDKINKHLEGRVKEGRLANLYV